MSLTAFLLALIVFWRWTADRLGAEVATGAVWLLSAFPLAVFFSAAYTESLYLLLVVSACYFAERRRFAPTAAAGLLSGLVRPNGLLLSIPIAWTMLIADRETTRHACWRGIAIAAPLAGLLCYCAYLGVEVRRSARVALGPGGLGHAAGAGGAPTAGVIDDRSLVADRRAAARVRARPRSRRSRGCSAPPTVSSSASTSRRRCCGTA